MLVTDQLSYSVAVAPRATRHRAQRVSGHSPPYAARGAAPSWWLAGPSGVGDAWDDG